MELSSPYLLSFIVVIPTLVLIMGLFSRKNQFLVEGRVCRSREDLSKHLLTHTKTVVLTGGSTGMGRGLAKLLAQKGANIVLVARDEKKLEAAIVYISVRFQPHPTYKQEN